MTEPRAEAPFTCSVSFIGKEGHGDAAVGAAKAHIDYITRSSALTEIVAVGAVPEHGTPVGRLRAFAKAEIDRKAASRSNARVLDKIVVAIPYEVPDVRRGELLRAFVLELAGVDTATDLGEAVALAAVHGDPANPHAHLALMDGKEPKAAARRRAKATGAQRVRQRDVFRLSEKNAVERVRETWERVANRVLEDLGVPTRIDRRSLEARGIARIPTAHEGPKRRALVAKVHAAEGPAAAGDVIHFDPRMEPMRANALAARANAVLAADATRAAAIQDAERRVAAAEAAAERERQSRVEAEALAEQERAAKEALATRVAHAEAILRDTEDALAPVATAVAALIQPADPLPTKALVIARASYAAGARKAGVKAADQVAKATTCATKEAERADDWEAEALERGRLAEEASRTANRLRRALEDEQEARADAESRAAEEATARAAADAREAAATSRATTAEAGLQAALADMASAQQRTTSQRERNDRLKSRLNHARGLIDDIETRMAGIEATEDISIPDSVPLPNRVTQIIEAVRRTAYNRGLAEGARRMRRRAAAIARWLWKRLVKRREEAEQAKAIVAAMAAGELTGRGPEWLTLQEWQRARALSNLVRNGKLAVPDPPGPARIIPFHRRNRDDRTR
ncbi:MobA/MobL family protein [Azospirillum sp. sgz302134]